MRLFLTGATGFIGRPLTTALRERAIDVVALVRRPESPQARALAALGVDCVRGDVTDAASVREAMAGADIVLHNAGNYELGLDARGRQRMYESNVIGTETVLGQAFELGVPRCVYVSSVIAFGETGPQARDETFERQARCQTHYERTKTDAHEIARRYQQRGLPLVIVCPHSAIGPNDHSPWGYFLRLHLLMPYLFGWSQRGIHCPVDLRDVVAGIVLAVEKGRAGETYILAGEPKSRREHIAYWTERTGKHVRLWVPGWLAVGLFASVEPLERAAGLPAFISRETARAGGAHFNFSSEKAKRDLGWTHRSAREMWLDTIDRERELVDDRPRRSLVSRLQPVR